ncbi:MAG: Crp/Fnr family transcriptional regulator, partial [Fervidobacterium sp.]
KLLAAAVIFSSEPRYPVDVETVKPSIFLRIEKNTFVQYLMKSGTLLKNYLGIVSDDFTFITERFYEIAMKNLVQKVCSYLVRLMDTQQSQQVTMDMTKEELARQFGVTRPALSRVFAELEKLGIIETDEKVVKVLKEKYMRDQAEFG